jgi:hypothetical protein
MVAAKLNEWSRGWNWRALRAEFRTRNLRARGTNASAHDQLKPVERALANFRASGDQSHANDPVREASVMPGGKTDPARRHY